MDFTGSYSRQNMLRFLIPLLAAESFQQLYGLINTVVVNHVLDYRAVAVIGACSGLISIRNNLLSGMIFGFGIYLGKAVGSADQTYFQRAFSGAFWYAALLGALGVVLLPLTGAMLVAGNVPAALYQDAVWYLAVSLGGSFCVALKLLLLVTLQAMGETRFFSVLAAVGVVANTALVVLFVGVFHGGVAFSALAAILTNLLLAICLYLHIRKTHRDVLKLILPSRIPWNIWGELMLNGMTKSAYFVLGSLGKLVLQRAINTFSVEIIAGQSWGVCLQTILFAPLGELGTASGVITGQNVGARNPTNIRMYHRKLRGAMLLIGGAEVLFIYLAGAPVLQLLCGMEKPPEVAQAAVLWIRITVLALPFCFTILYRNALQALGRYAQVVFLGGVEFVGICLTAGYLVPNFGYPAAAVGVAVSWIVQALVGSGFFYHAMKGESRLG